jgi:hypothetical protein
MLVLQLWLRVLLKHPSASLAQIRQNLPKHANCDFSQNPAKSNKICKISKIRENPQNPRKSANSEKNRQL